MMRMNRLRQSAAAHKLKKMLFLLGSRGPESRWYGGYKLGELVQSLKQPFSPNQLPIGYGRWIDERIVEYPWLFSQMPDGPGKLLDAGSILNHHFIVSHPKLQPKDVTIMTLAPEAECYWRRNISYVYGDIRNMVFRDEIFDCVVCISTLEHVGLDNRRFHGGEMAQFGREPESYLRAVRELRRVLKSDGRCFVSMPFGHHAAQDWQQIFDGEMVDQLIQAFAPRACGTTYFRYSDESGWKTCDRAAAADARYFNFRTDKPWKGHPAAAEAVVCLELQK